MVSCQHIPYYKWISLMYSMCVLVVIGTYEAKLTHLFLWSVSIKHFSYTRRSCYKAADSSCQATADNCGDITITFRWTVGNFMSTFTIWCVLLLLIISIFNVEHLCDKFDKLINRYLRWWMLMDADGGCWWWTIHIIINSRHWWRNCDHLLREFRW